MLYLNSKYLVMLRLVPTFHDQKNAHSNVNITSSRNSEPKKTHHKLLSTSYMISIQVQYVGLYKLILKTLEGACNISKNLEYKCKI